MGIEVCIGKMLLTEDIYRYALRPLIYSRLSTIVKWYQSKVDLRKILTVGDVRCVQLLSNGFCFISHTFCIMNMLEWIIFHHSWHFSTFAFCHLPFFACFYHSKTIFFYINGICELFLFDHLCFSSHISFSTFW